MTEQQLEDLMRGARCGKAVRDLPVDFSSRVLAGLGPQMAVLWSPRFLMGLTLAVIAVAAVSALWAGNQVEPEPPVLTLYQGSGLGWWE
jgi:hypothetical protein